MATEIETVTRAKMREPEAQLDDATSETYDEGGEMDADEYERERLENIKWVRACCLLSLARSPCCLSP